MQTEIVYPPYGNTIDRVLVADGRVPSLSSVTSMTLILSNGMEIDSDTTPAAFDWSKTLSSDEAARIVGANEGDSKLVLSLGALGIPAGSYTAKLVVYDPQYPTGLVWGYFPIMWKGDF